MFPETIVGEAATKPLAFAFSASSKSKTVFPVPLCPRIKVVLSREPGLLLRPDVKAFINSFRPIKVCGRLPKDGKNSVIDHIASFFLFFLFFSICSLLASLWRMSTETSGRHTKFMFMNWLGTSLGTEMDGVSPFLSFQCFRPVPLIRIPPSPPKQAAP